MKKLLIILAMLFIGCSETGNYVAVDYDQTDVENDSTEIVIDSIDTIDTIDTIDSVDVVDTIDSVKDTIITNEDTVIVSSSSNVEDESSSSINNTKEESSSSMENDVESSSSSEKLVESSSSELIVSSSSEKKVEISSSSKNVESSSSEEIVNSSSSVDEDEDYVDENEPKSTEPHYVELDELKLNGFKVENNIAYLSWENNTDYTMQINVTYSISCNIVSIADVGVDSTIMYTIKANSVKEKAIYEIKNEIAVKQCIGYVKAITATENDKSNFAGWKMDSDRGLENIIFGN